MMNRWSALFKGDRVLWILIGLLMLSSLPLIYSSTGQLALRKYDGDTERSLLAHGFKLLLGGVIMLFAHRIPYLWLGRLSAWGVYIGCTILAVTLVYGQTINSASRSLVIPFTNISFQGSDPARFFFILWLARGLALLQKNEQIRRFRDGWMHLLGGLMVTAVLIAPENLSTALMLLGVGIGMIWVAGARLVDLTKVVGGGLLVVFLLVTVAYWAGWARARVWKNRMESYLSPTPGQEDFQVTQAKIAVSDGGLWGKGPGKSIQRNFLPHAYSDFIYAIVIEEYGIAGAAWVLVLYLGLFYRIRKIAMNARSPYGAYIASGMGMALMAQAVVNMLVSVSAMPVTGQTLPFISHGGSSILINALAMGVILSVSRDMTGEGDWSELDIEGESQTNKGGDAVLSKGEVSYA
ncbi:MAG: FtsW/RodA/SpoVE family cell cycle protein [Bacteroidia bacterium]|nr:FtsW/RodA/SpoVE family cell cycle protein [Bacteroidia bacterium]